MKRSVTAFQGTTRIAFGPLAEVARSVHHAVAAHARQEILTFEDANGRVIDLNLSGTAEDVATRYTIAPDTRARGRPKLGVTAREVTLLPRHWDWLATQPGGASAALRRLVETARRTSAAGDRRRTAQEAAYRVMQALAGDLPGYEEALRTLFADDPEGYDRNIATWPEDVRRYCRALAFPPETDEMAED
jgi:uncharacterized protein